MIIAPTFNNFNRMLWQHAFAMSVPSSARRRIAPISVGRERLPAVVVSRTQLERCFFTLVQQRLVQRGSGVRLFVGQWRGGSSGGAGGGGGW